MINKFRYFCSIAKNGSMTRAAEECNISQPALSASIRRLEAELGVSLFLRTTHGLKLTEAGKRCLPYAQTLCSSYYSLTATIQFLKAENNMLHVGSGMQHVAMIVNNYLLDNPGTLADIEQYFQYEKLKHSLITHLTDVVLSSPPIEGKGITMEIVHSEPFFLLLPKSSPYVKLNLDNISLAEIAEMPNILTLPPDAPMRKALDASVSSANLQLHYSMQIENSAVLDILRNDAEGKFVTIYPEFRALQITKDIPSLTYISIDNQKFTRDIAISYLTENGKKSHIKAFVKYVKEFYLNQFHV